MPIDPAWLVTTVVSIIGVGTGVIAFVQAGRKDAAKEGELKGAVTERGAATSAQVNEVKTALETLGESVGKRLDDVRDDLKEVRDSVSATRERLVGLEVAQKGIAGSLAICQPTCNDLGNRVAALEAGQRPSAPGRLTR